ncbi:MAG TPA: SDR family NAD(P)-dependent oxidoreductase [Acidimicrobiia bacterium]|nr:SDR family NAD(P)-dependent oxidoreductase [Acidimicrobiia bacterium]
MKDFAGKVAVVTGSGGGIGKALVERFTDEGMKAVVADIDAALVDRTTAEFKDRGRDVIGVVTDVTELESVEALRDRALDAFGAVHVVCNNAGVGSASEGQFWEHHVNDWRWSLDVNVMGVVNGINAFVPTMLAQDTEGAVVNTTSGNGGFTPLIHSAIYATTKAAVTCLTECLWGQLRELDAKVTAHLLYPSTRTPGMLNTGIWRPGRNRQARYDRPGAPPASEGRDSLTPMLERAKAAGQEIAFAPLSEVADLCFEGIRDDVFWMCQPGSGSGSLARAESQAERTLPTYLVQGFNVMTGRKAGSRD